MFIIDLFKAANLFIEQTIRPHDRRCERPGQPIAAWKVCIRMNIDTPDAGKA
jgi:hypothetical protein